MEQVKDKIEYGVNKTFETVKHIADDVSDMSKKGREKPKKRTEEEEEGEPVPENKTTRRPSKKPETKKITRPEFNDDYEESAAYMKKAKKPEPKTKSTVEPVADSTE